MVVGGRKIEPAILGWLAAMLFAMPPLRNAMPEARRAWISEVKGKKTWPLPSTWQPAFLKPSFPPSP
jgi:hypothetical protein